MKLKDIKEKAKSMGVDVKKIKSKEELIHAIQRAEGYQECFKSRTECDQFGCLWRKDCI